MTKCMLYDEFSQSIHCLYYLYYHYQFFCHSICQYISRIDGPWVATLSSNVGSEAPSHALEHKISLNVRVG